MGDIRQGRPNNWNWRVYRVMNRLEGFCCGGSLRRAFGPTALCLRAGLAAHIESYHIIINSSQEGAKK
jgi:hypothetical protein